MAWEKRLPRLITKALYWLWMIYALVTIVALIARNNTVTAFRDKLSGYSMLLVVMLLMALATVLEKPGPAVALFIVICDVLFVFALLSHFFIEDSFEIQFLFGFMPVFLMLIVLTYPKTLHYMQDRYYEAVRSVEQKTTTSRDT